MGLLTVVAFMSQWVSDGSFIDTWWVDRWMGEFPPPPSVFVALILPAFFMCLLPPSSHLLTFSELCELKINEAGLSVLKEPNQVSQIQTSKQASEASWEILRRAQGCPQRVSSSAKGIGKASQRRSIPTGP